MVVDHIRKNCRDADKYLPNSSRFEVKWMRQPHTNDHHERRMREWTVTDPITGAYWRLYEDTGEVVTVIGVC